MSNKSYSIEVIQKIKLTDNCDKSNFKNIIKELFLICIVFITKVSYKTVNKCFVPKIKSIMEYCEYEIARYNFFTFINFGFYTDYINKNKGV